MMTRRERYDDYEPSCRVCLSERYALQRAIGQLVASLRRAGVSYDEGNAPMSDVNRIILRFESNGDFRNPEIHIAGMYYDDERAHMDVSGCPIVVCLEPKPDEENDEC